MVSIRSSSVCPVSESTHGPFLNSIYRANTLLFKFKMTIETLYHSKCSFKSEVCPLTTSATRSKPCCRTRHLCVTILASQIWPRVFVDTGLEAGPKSRETHLRPWIMSSHLTFICVSPAPGHTALTATVRGAPVALETTKNWRENIQETDQGNVWIYSC